MANILLIDDEPSILESLEMFLSEKGYAVSTAQNGKSGLALFTEQPPDVVILDIRLPDMSGLEVLRQMQHATRPVKVIMITAFQDMETTIEAMKNGAYDYIHKPLDVDDIEKAIERAAQVLKMEQETPRGGGQRSPETLEVIIGKSGKMLDVFKLIGMLCQNRAPVLIQGETGTGKELTARILHQNSPWHDEPFVIFDCSSVVETLLESELFGHEKGAFTGANQLNKGKIESAGRGTLFLDEVGELPLNLQKKFLGFLQRQEYMRVGGHQKLQAQCRIVAATNRDLAAMVQQRLFREDLYYRLKVVTLHLPPLRERLTDLPLLVNHFLHKINRNLSTDVWKLQEGALNRLMTHPWTGNVRELENVLVEAVIRARGKVILQEDLDKILMMTNELQKSFAPASLDNVEKEHIENMLTEVGWNRSEAARRLGISQPTLRSKIRKYGLLQPNAND
ncbi:putative fused DNA-binding response regulator in two-component regulatory system with [Candidatus Moduliflexus flocculans]|uniref:DNA-binding transcriptional regulator NtrC n=1 Tax=Candidatus Moduliflexus flocculans TaxID=1499966 RepID=A0A0S6VUL7_9BACT|nr:putative fused DNA-binding response regulator in two-component regulatory system with [Candidatus Moduliflexus flocculans]